MAPGRHLSDLCSRLRRSLRRMSKRPKEEAEKEGEPTKGRPPTPMPKSQHLTRRNALGGGARQDCEDCIYRWHPLDPALGASAKNLDLVSLRCELGWYD
ncbi:hypothetical protein [macacine gammaherpesvirus 13]|uniref:BNLF2b n=1 Tax=macacine gammaherpesvirus 13 TaxID=2341050 RepID=A0A3G1T4J6_9GAMA|nr:hypothetical protein QKT43_gp87 [Macaca arctoides gammaherpesvirus 1]AYA49871.1 hypothetical protein [Macaca arctoides gammaherpesvirus 1]